MESEKIEMWKVEIDGHTIDCVGTCPECSGHVKYIGERRVLDGFLKGSGFLVHAGKCIVCGSEYGISVK